MEHIRLLNYARVNNLMSRKHIESVDVLSGSNSFLFELNRGVRRKR